MWYLGRRALALACLIGLSGCSNDTAPSQPSDGPEAAFESAPRRGYPPLTVEFTDKSSAGSASITAWRWDFGDGQTSPSSNPTHVYEVSGTYAVTLTVTTAAGSDAITEPDYITVQSLKDPIADFTASPRQGIWPLRVRFQDRSLSAGAPVFWWEWTFGDGATSKERNPRHTYAQAGTYTVSLRAITETGSDVETKVAFIEVVPPDPPTASFSGNPLFGTGPLTVRFDDRSDDGGTPMTSWTWDFGDGATSSEAAPRHTYSAEPGSYTVTLTVTNAVGSDTETKPDYVRVLPLPHGPSADFQADVRTGAIPLSVAFTDLSKPGTHPITSWLWDFGDGTTNTAPNPVHTYAVPGPHDVSLTVTTAIGSDTEIKANYITESCPGSLDDQVYLGSDIRWLWNTNPFDYRFSRCPIDSSGVATANCSVGSDGQVAIAATAWAYSSSGFGHIEAEAEVGKEFEIEGTCTGSSSATARIRVRYDYRGTVLGTTRSPACIELTARVTNLTSGAQVAEQTLLSKCGPPGEQNIIDLNALSDDLTASLQVGERYRVSIHAYATSEARPYGSSTADFGTESAGRHVRLVFVDLSF